MCASYLLGVSVMSSEHRFSKEGEFIGFPQRGKKGKRKGLYGNVIRCKLETAPLPSFPSTSPFSDKIFAYYFSWWSKLFQYCFVIGLQLCCFSCYALLWDCNGITPWTVTSQCHSTIALNYWGIIKAFRLPVGSGLFQKKGLVRRRVQVPFAVQLKHHSDLVQQNFSLWEVMLLFWPCQIAQEAKQCSGLVHHIWILRCLELLKLFSKMKLSCCLARQMGRKQELFQRR